MKILAALATLTLAHAALAAGPVREYSRDPDISRSEQLRSVRPLVPAADPRTGLLINPAPYPNNRTDDADRLQNGRLWVSRAPVSSRYPIAERTLTQPGPASYGAAPEAHQELIFVQPSDIRSVVGISPWQTIDASTLRQIQRLEPNLGKTVDSPESERLLNELRAAQHQWLKEEGYIQRVRTHVNTDAEPSATAEAQADVEPAKEIKPRAVIRVQPVTPPKSGRIATATETPAPDAAE